MNFIMNKQKSNSHLKIKFTKSLPEIDHLPLITPERQSIPSYAQIAFML